MSNDPNIKQQSTDPINIVNIQATSKATNNKKTNYILFTKGLWTKIDVDLMDIIEWSINVGRYYNMNTTSQPQTALSTELLTL